MIDWYHVLEVILPTVFVAGVSWGSMKAGFGRDIKSIRTELKLHREATDTWRGHIDDQILLLVQKLIPDRKEK